MADDYGVQVINLTRLVADLRGREWRDVNSALRQEARGIAEGMIPDIQNVVRQSNAPQARAFINTVGYKSDRVPVVLVGKTTPKFASKFTRGRRKRNAEGALVGADPRRRRGAMAHGIFYGPAGGKRDTPAAENYYQIPRDNSGGPLRYLKGRNIITDKAARMYLEAYMHVLARLGWTVEDRRSGGVGLG